MDPGVSAIAAAIDAVNLYSDPDTTRIARIEHNIRHFWSPGEAPFCNRYGELLPTLAAIDRTIDPRLFGACKNDVGVRWMDCDRPDLLTIHRGFEQVPGRAFVFTAIDPDFGPGQNAVGILRIHR